MTQVGKSRSWTKHLVYRVECTRPTWKLRLGLIACLILLLWATRDALGLRVERSLVCDPDATLSDAVLVDNLDPGYELFERAAGLLRAGRTGRVFVPVMIDANTGHPDAVSRGVAEVMAKMAQLPAFNIIPITETEPIALNAAYRVRAVLEREHVRSLTVVTPIWRSRRSALTYGAALRGAKVVVRCVPVPGSHPPNWWMTRWHGIEQVSLQWLKLQYYRFYVLPFVHQS